MREYATRETAALATHDYSALVAGERRRKATDTEEHPSPCRERLPYLAGEERASAPPAAECHACPRSPRSATPIEGAAFRATVASLNPLPHLHARCGGCEEGCQALTTGALEHELAGVDPGGPGGIVGALMFVEHDEGRTGGQGGQAGQTVFPPPTGQCRRRALATLTPARRRRPRSRAEPRGRSSPGAEPSGRSPRCPRPGAARNWPTQCARGRAAHGQSQ